MSVIFILFSKCCQSFLQCEQRMVCFALLGNLTIIRNLPQKNLPSGGNSLPPQQRKRKNCFKSTHKSIQKELRKWFLFFVQFFLYLSRVMYQPRWIEERGVADRSGQLKEHCLWTKEQSKGAEILISAYMSIAMRQLLDLQKGCLHQSERCW